MTKRRRLTEKQQTQLFLEHGGICHICEQKIWAERGEKWEVEHVLALAIYGRDDWENLRPAHVKCHKGKTREDRKILAKSDRIRARHLGVPKIPRGRAIPGSRASGIRKRMNGTVERW